MHQGNKAHAHLLSGDSDGLRDNEGSSHLNVQVGEFSPSEDIWFDRLLGYGHYAFTVGSADFCGAGALLVLGQLPCKHCPPGLR